MLDNCNIEATNIVFEMKGGNLLSRLKQSVLATQTPLKLSVLATQTPLKLSVYIM